VRIVLRVILVALVVAVGAVAAIPLLVLRDLTTGGTGWGLCPDGIANCTTSYFAGFELVCGLVLALVALLAVLRLAIRSLRMVEHRYDRIRAGGGASPAGPHKPEAADLTLVR
jgi:hypothetical protein